MSLIVAPGPEEASAAAATTQDGQQEEEEMNLAANSIGNHASSRSRENNSQQQAKKAAAPKAVAAWLDPVLSPAAADLVGQLVATDPAQRASAVSLLAHPWLHDDGTGAFPDNP